MSDPSTTPTPELDPQTPTPVEPAPAATEPQGDPEPVDIEGLKKALKSANAEAMKNRLRLKEIEDRDLSELQRAKRDAQEAVENAKTATVTAFREAAVKFGGISAEDAELFLTGTDAETLGRQAARLVAQADTNPQPGPRPDLSQGGKGGTPNDDSGANWLQELTRR